MAPSNSLQDNNSMTQKLLLIVTIIGVGFLSVKSIKQEKEIQELQVRLDEQELLNKIGKELITSRLTIR
jgi:ArsR family metal-binding transcriptional regulator